MCVFSNRYVSPGYDDDTLCRPALNVSRKHNNATRREMLDLAIRSVREFQCLFVQCLFVQCLFVFICAVFICAVCIVRYVVIVYTCGFGVGYIVKKNGLEE